MIKVRDFKQKITLSLALSLCSIIDTCQADDAYAAEERGCFPPSWYINHKFIRADLLFLKAFEDGLSDPWEPTKTVKFFSPKHNEDITLSRGVGKEPQFKWDLGYRLAAGVDFHDCDWSIAAYWMHFSPCHGKSSNQRPRWDLDYDTLDLMVGYKCPFNACFTLDAYGGIRGARIDQRLQGHFISTNRHRPQLETSKKAKQDFQGYGGIFGVGGEFKFGSITFFVAGDAGTLFGYNHLHSHVKNRSHSHSAEVCTYKRQQKARQYFIDSAIGLRWETFLCSGMHLALEAGFEYHNYFNHNRMLSEGNLCIDGGNLSLALQF